MLVGMHGAGKTSALAKLATELAFTRKNPWSLFLPTMNVWARPTRWPGFAAC